METTFITIHDLSRDARVKYVSDSVEDILGYRPRDVVNKSCWEYFHPHEVPFAKAIHGRGVRLDKAAVLNYCRIKHKDGYWVGCECVFTVVYDVLVSCTSIYQGGNRSEKRASDAPVIRRIFASSPKDPRYHMLSYLSNKFQRPSAEVQHEPRAALFLNRFTRTSPVMFATNGVAEILGLQPQQLIAKSFYYCISEDCLQDAVRCIESAKANDSIAYLRFRFRNPLQEDPVNEDIPVDDAPVGSSSDEDEDDGGVHLGSDGSPEVDDVAMQSASSGSPPDSTNSIISSADQHVGATARDGIHHSNSETSTEMDTSSNEHVFDLPLGHTESSASSLPALVTEASMDHENSFSRSQPPRQPSPPPPPQQEQQPQQQPQQPQEPAAQEVEVEAVVSCTSDGLVVILRRAQPSVPDALAHPTSEATRYSRGVFASPWATNPIYPPGGERPFGPDQGFNPGFVPGATTAATPPVSAMQSSTRASSQASASASASASGFTSAQTTTNVAPESHTFWSTIRDVAVFAWSLTGINGSLSQYSRGQPTGEAVPPGGLPVWNPNATPQDQPSDAWNGFEDNSHRRVGSWGGNVSAEGSGSGTGTASGSGSGSGNPILGPGSSGSDEEIVWRRVPAMPEWRPSTATQARRGRGSVDRRSGGGSGSSGGAGASGRRHHHPYR